MIAGSAPRWCSFRCRADGDARVSWRSSGRLLKISTGPLIFRIGVTSLAGRAIQAEELANRVDDG